MRKKNHKIKQLQMVMRLGTCRHLQIANTAHHCSHHQTLVFTIGNLGIMDTNLMVDNELVVDEELVKPLTVDNIFEVGNVFKVDNNLAIEVDKELTLDKLEVGKELTLDMEELSVVDKDA